jgi:F-type H+-transporting ATPase subunit gamma
MALKQVKNKIIATGKTGKVTKAMEAVSAVKMRKSQERALKGKPYAEAAIRILTRISGSRDVVEYFKKKADGLGTHCFIVITSDKGLAGSLNSTILKEADRAISAYNENDVRIIAFGRKAYEYYTRRNHSIDAHYVNVSDDVSLTDMEDVTKFITESFDTGTYNDVSIVYQSFVSTFEQNAVRRQILPLDPLTLEVMVRDIVPKRGEYSDYQKELTAPVYTIEPAADEVMATLIPQLLKIMVYHALLENKASEHSARMVAMKNATDKAKEMTHSLTLLYNRERQAAITAEVSEITGGIEAMRNV